MLAQQQRVVHGLLAVRVRPAPQPLGRHPPGTAGASASRGRRAPARGNRSRQGGKEMSCITATCLNAPCLAPLHQGPAAGAPRGRLRVGHRRGLQHLAHKRLALRDALQPRLPLRLRARAPGRPPDALPHAGGGGAAPSRLVQRAAALEAVALARQRRLQPAPRTPASCARPARGRPGDFTEGGCGRTRAARPRRPRRPAAASRAGGTPACTRCRT